MAIDRRARSSRALIDADVDRWYEIAAEESWAWAPQFAAGDRLQRLTGLLLHAPEFRPVFYFRAESAGVSQRLLGWTARLFPGPAECHIRCSDIGPGLFISHGWGTMIVAEKIGANCRIHQHVSIGWAGPGEAPVIEDNVIIYPGAVVVGAITIGDGAVIGANAVVTTSVPAQTTVMGVPARPLMAR